MCHNNLYTETTWCTCRLQGTNIKRSAVEIQKASTTLLQPGSRPFCSSFSTIRTEKPPAKHTARLPKTPKEVLTDSQKTKEEETHQTTKQDDDE